MANNEGRINGALEPVSYTHLDVYKRQPVSDVRGDFADFPNRQNRSALADLKTLRVFNLPARHDFFAIGLRLSRAFPRGLADEKLEPHSHFILRMRLLCVVQFCQFDYSDSTAARSMGRPAR